MDRIFIVEDDPTITAAMLQEFHKWQYIAQTVTSWDHVIDEIQNFNPDIVLMDITLPTFDGFYWTNQLRQLSKVPIIFISAAEMDPNAVRAIAAGADDYIVKPFSLNVLVSKIQAVIRRTKQAAKPMETLTFEDYQLTILTNELKHGDVSVKLTPTEGTILKLLFLNAGKLVTKKQLMQTIWQGGLFIEESVLTVNMSRLRDKLAQVNLRNRLVTERGHGYRLVAADEL
ncbi:DNA-binding response regulator [Lentilactobacillus fungorum]|uniref:DNA-binding response regulator n=1 Tax=Lentilactobacillus fungorum TaxID=2201250 RepID=A0ABQ3VYL2_9LACO|nr:response regulator transcription factor [Lentilactobacillus fungorum]GHP13990.1 DNA-binding response regulator [Lentilactobacillus fungorum]